MSSPLFSIIIPTYNRDTLLPKAIESVLHQQFTDWELIIVDDGSTDDTQAVVQPFLTDARVRYHSQANRELNGARNTGVRLAKGTYLAFLDDDDFYLENHLSVLFDFLSSKGFPTLTIRTRLLIQEENNKYPGTLLPDTDREATLQGLWEDPVNLLSFVFHRDIFLQIQFKETLLLFEDIHFLLAVFVQFPFLQLEQATVVYHLQESSRTLQYTSLKHFENKKQAIDLCWEDYELDRFLPISALSAAHTRVHLHFSRIAFRQGAYKWGWSYWTQGLTYLTTSNLTKFFHTFAYGIYYSVFWAIRNIKNT